MSEFTQHLEERVALLHKLYNAITRKVKAFETIKENEDKIELIIGSDIVVFVHQLVERGDDIENMKSGINKLLNVTYKAITNSPYDRPARGSYFDICLENNKQMVRLVEKLRPVLISLNKDLDNKDLRINFCEILKELSDFEKYYVIKENVIFPLIEKELPDYKCITLMWAFHDDIRKNIKSLTEMMDCDEKLDLKAMNRLAGDIFFNIYAVKFREERMLFPFMEQNIENRKIEALLNDSIELGFPYFNPEPKNGNVSNNSSSETIASADDSTTDPDKTDLLDTRDLLDLKTGLLTLDQLILIFRHLPLDITYVDENGKVRFYSNPPHRIFPRTTAIIGRDVKNCHPHESVHVVQKIVESFRNGSRDHADFWINMKGKKILIQYFAVRDENGKYRGVLEASQEISGIQALEGEQRILDWE